MQTFETKRIVNWLAPQTKAYLVSTLTFVGTAEFSFVVSGRTAARPQAHSSVNGKHAASKNINCKIFHWKF